MFVLSAALSRFSFCGVRIRRLQRVATRSGVLRRDAVAGRDAVSDPPFVPFGAPLGGLSCPLPERYQFLRKSRVTGNSVIRSVVQP